MSTLKKTFIVILCIAICFLTGYVSSKFQIDALNNWYPFLNKPSLTPPNIVFPVAWSTLYFLMGLSIGLILISSLRDKFSYAYIFIIQLVLNFTWSLIFFYFKSPGIGLINLVLLEILIIYYSYRTFHTARLSSILFWPYILWLLFAGYLNTYIWLYN